jgi:hypothetical protein
LNARVPVWFRKFLAVGRAGYHSRLLCTTSPVTTTSSRPRREETYDGAWAVAVLANDGRAVPPIGAVASIGAVQSIGAAASIAANASIAAAAQIGRQTARARRPTARRRPPSPPGSSLTSLLRRT